MNMKNFIIGAVLAVVVAVLLIGASNDITSGTNNSIETSMNLSFGRIEDKAYEVMSKINETAQAGVVSLTGGIAIVTLPITVASLVLESIFLSFSLATTLISQVTGLPPIVISAIFTIFAIWAAFELIRLIWGRS